MTKKFDRDLLLDCARELLSYLALQDPVYADRIEITKSERTWDDLKCALGYMAGVLDRGEHMYYCEYEFMAPNYVGHKGPRPCTLCGVEFSPGTAGETICSKASCQELNAKMLDEKFEASSAK